MKCPKCTYLSFDTGERCKNCGYDFSLMTSQPVDAVGELSLRSDGDDALGSPWSDTLDVPLIASTGVATVTPPAVAPARTSRAAAPPAPLDGERPVPPPSFRGAPSLPLFSTSPDGDDQPLIRVPSKPRPPLAVRRTPESPRLRAAPREAVRHTPEPALHFVDEPEAETPAAVLPRRRSTAAPEALETSRAGARIYAAAIDHVILAAIDVVVLYLTLRIASLSMSEWRALPMLPMGTFLGLLKLSYFTAFTCVGGQTIGKMAARIRVVSDENLALDVPQALHRALAGAVSFLTLGAGFVPALVGSDRRALHDRLAHTRVVSLPAA